MINDPLQRCRRWGTRVSHQRQHGTLDILVDESADERDTVAGVLLWKELMGAFSNNDQMITTK